MRRNYLSSPFDAFLFPRLSMNTRLMGFDDPFEDIEREYSRDPFANLDHLLSHLAPQLGVPLTVTDAANPAAAAASDPNASSSAAKPTGNQKQLQQAGGGAKAAGNDEKQVANQSAAMDVDAHQAPQNLWLSAYSRAPALDVVERDKEFQVNVDVPGVNKEDIKLQITEDRRGRKLLTVSGERKEEKNEEDNQRGYRSVHRLYGHFSRSLRLPETCDTKGGVQAKHENGVLKITLPKLNPEALKPQGIDIKID